MTLILLICFIGVFFVYIYNKSEEVPGNKVAEDIAKHISEMKNKEIEEVSIKAKRTIGEKQLLCFTYENDEGKTLGISIYKKLSNEKYKREFIKIEAGYQGENAKGLVTFNPYDNSMKTRIIVYGINENNNPQEITINVDGEDMKLKGEGEYFILEVPKSKEQRSTEERQRE